jgi:hypothetical protein
MAPKILITTTVRWPAAARYAAGFADVTCVVDALAPAGHPLGQSRYIQSCYAYRPLWPQDALSTAIEKTRPDLIVPCDDRAVAQMVELHRRLATSGKPSFAGEIIERSLGNPENYSILMSRAGALAAARELGISTPQTLVIRDEAEFEDALSRLGLPIAIKVDGSWGGEGVVLADSVAEAHVAWQEFSRKSSRLRSVASALLRGDMHFISQAIAPKPSVVTAQKFVFGQLGTSAFACWQGKVLSAIHMEVLQTTSAVGPASVLKRAESIAMDRAAVLLAERFCLSGLHGLDFIRDSKGTTHLVEINPRATQIGPLALGKGHDLVAALASQVGQHVIEREAVTESDLIALFPQEWIRDPASAYLSVAYHDVPWDDPEVLRGSIALSGKRDVPYAEIIAQLKRAERVSPI